MRLKHLVVASLMAGALAVAGATTLAQPPEQNSFCQECVNTYHDTVEDCKRDHKGPDRRACIQMVEDVALECLKLAGCPLGRNRP